MNLVFVFLILGIIAGACSVSRKSKSITYNITVIDKNNNAFIDSARVILTAIFESRDVTEYIKYTDKDGRCSFSFDHNSSAQFQVRSMKKGFIGYYDNSYVDLNRAFSFLNEKTGYAIDLFLTSDTLNQRKFRASQLIKYDIDTLINL